ncbi:MAG: acetyl-CoA hydrolase [Cellvibrionaceae bacterium]|nr:acetyl-CoA hydrolase [Cellvibrionaceae bacterium]
MPRQIIPSEVAEIITHQSHVFIQGAIGEPRTIIEALESAQKVNKTVDYYGVSIPGINRFSPHEFHPGARFHSFFLHNQIANRSSNNLLFHPLHYRDTFRYLENHNGFDVAIIQVAPADANGNHSLGPTVDFVPSILARTKLIIAEVNQQLPAVSNGATIKHRDIDLIVAADHDLPCNQPLAGGVTETKIAKNVSALIDDGSCIQIGIGKLPSSILQQLRHHKRLGLHSGLISQDSRDLIEAGCITGENKSIDRHQHVTGIALGQKDFYQWVAKHPQVHFRPVDYTHDQKTLTALDQFVSINSVLEIDLLGQANAEHVQGRAVSASGGLIDFVRGARASTGGKSIIAMPATAMKGSNSRIVSRLPSDAITTLCRADIDYLVTEYGSASLFSLATDQRAQALIDVAAPEHRDALYQDWENSKTQGQAKRV